MNYLVRFAVLEINGVFKTFKSLRRIICKLYFCFVLGLKNIVKRICSAVAYRRCGLARSFVTHFVKWGSIFAQIVRISRNGRIFFRLQCFVNAHGLLCRRFGSSFTLRNLIHGITVCIVLDLNSRTRHGFVKSIYINARTRSKSVRCEQNILVLFYLIFKNSGVILILLQIVVETECIFFLQNKVLTVFCGNFHRLYVYACRTLSTTSAQNIKVKFLALTRHNIRRKHLKHTVRVFCGKSLAHP